jgi:Tfp pilus assembly protein PilN
MRIKRDDKLRLILFIASAALVILVMLNVYVVFLSAVKEFQLGRLKKKWDGLAKQREKVDQALKLSSNLSQDAKVIQQLVGSKISWSFKMNRLSQLLPGGIWFNQVSFKGANFTLLGSVISLKKEEMALINSFLNNLKQDKLFFADFNNIELTSVQRRVLGGYEISDFVLSGSLKE